jgi:hypothetical protein
MNIVLTCALTVITFLASAQIDSLQKTIFNTNSFRKGIYANFEEFKNNKPSITDGFTIVPNPGTIFKMDDEISFAGKRFIPNQMMTHDSIAIAAHIVDKKGKKIKYAYAFSDGKSLYINSALYQNYSNYYLRVWEIGKIVYFRDPKMNLVNGIVTGWVLAGLPGMLIGEASARSQPDGVIIFEEDGGSPFELDYKTLTSIFKLYDRELLTQLEAEEDRKTATVLEKYVIQFNRKHASR